MRHSQIPARDLLPADASMCEGYGGDGWTEDEHLVYNSLLDVGRRLPAGMPLQVQPATFEKLLDMMSRLPIEQDPSTDGTDLAICNWLLCDPEDPRLHLVIAGRKVYRGQ